MDSASILPQDLAMSIWALFWWKEKFQHQNKIMKPPTDKEQLILLNNNDIMFAYKTAFALLLYLE